MNTNRVLAGLGLLATGAVAATAIGRRRFEGEVSALVDELLGTAADRAERTTDDADRVVTEDDLTDLPAPVRRYFETVVPLGRPYVRTALIEQEGEFRLGDAGSAWHPFAATERVTTDPPGFVWDATIDVASVVPVRVIDAYVGGRGVLRARLLSAIPVADAEPGPEIDAGELARYLAEAPFYPTALLPRAGVEWAAIDARTAEATIERDGTAVSMAFHFDDDGLVDRVRTEDRARAVDGGYEPTPWVGRFWDYAERDGLLVPTEGAVGWDLPEGLLEYWRGTVRPVAYEPGETRVEVSDRRIE